LIDSGQLESALTAQSAATRKSLTGGGPAGYRWRCRGSGLRGDIEQLGGCAVTHSIGRFFVAGGIILAALYGGAAAYAAGPFTLTSPGSADNKPFATKNAGDNKTNPNCVGQNVSPPLAWANPPEGTKSFALVMTDPEGRGGLGVIHMVTYGIAATVKGFAEGELSKPSDKYVGGKSTMGLATYFGPCTPPGDWHHYTLVLIATDLDTTALQPGMTLPDLMTALTGHTKGAAGLVHRFRHPS
jgi:Raf kinase inhibitor-like YbhB/YbcL family protein